MGSSGKRSTYFIAFMLLSMGACYAGGMNPIKMFKAGGWVMYPILALNVIMLAVSIERFVVIFLQNRKLKPAKFVALFEETYKKTNGDKEQTVDEMIAYVKKRGGVCSQIVMTAMEKYKDGKSRNLGPTDLKHWIQEAAEAKAVTEIPVLEAHLIALAVIANIATLCGLFGTVVGMIESFTAMSEAVGGVKADEMAGGIAIALVATAFGLVVAVPALILYNYLKSYVEGFVLQLQETLDILVDALV